MNGFQRGAIRIGSLLFLFLALPSPAFDGERAFRFLQDQCALGTREPGSPGHTRAKTFFESFLKTQKGAYSRDDFTYRDSLRKIRLPLTNFSIRFKGASRERLLFCAHWDCRPWADRDKNPLFRAMPVPGANDGASGVAVLMELCMAFSEKPPVKSVEIVLFDGEDYGSPGREHQWCLGSKRFASRANPKDYLYAVLLDMVGDKNLLIPMEPLSMERAPAVVQKVFDTARLLNLSAFSPRPGPGVYDDHIPLLDRGIPAVDLIDFDYPAWHTTADTPDQCSPKSLESVGRLLIHLAYER